MSGLTRRLCLAIPIFFFLSGGAAWSGPLVAEKSLGQQKALALRLKFPDVTPKVPVGRLEEKYFTKLNRYMSAVSYGQTTVVGQSKGWYTLPEPVANYKISAHNLKVDRSRIEKLVQHAIDLADREVDFSAYSFVILSLGAVRKNFGMTGLCAYPGMLGWSETKRFTTKGGQVVPGGVVIFCENAHLGVVFHDVAHVLGGVQGGRRVLPCLYDHDLQAKEGSFRGYAQFYIVNLGYWDPMSCHMVTREQGPPGICSWTMMRLNWLKDRLLEIKPGQNKTVTLGPLVKPGSGPAAVKVVLDKNTYYLIENRQPVGPDRVLPSSGVLILFCDDRVAECRHGQAPAKLINANPQVEELKGAAFNLGPGQNPAFQDPQRGLTVKLLDKTGLDYRLAVSWTR